jgi:hypothetical protein
LSTFSLGAIDYHIYEPDEDGKTKIDHLCEMLLQVIYHKQLPFYAVLMDSWYATKTVMTVIDRLGKIYYCPLKSNRAVDDSGGINSYRAVSTLFEKALAFTEAGHYKQIQARILTDMAEIHRQKDKIKSQIRVKFSKGE